LASTSVTSSTVRRRHPAKERTEAWRCDVRAGRPPVA
jgi:hypothetical protein